jgi:hypothetical protein
MGYGLPPPPPPPPPPPNLNCTSTGRNCPTVFKAGTNDEVGTFFPYFHQLTFAEGIKRERLPSAAPGGVHREVHTTLPWQIIRVQQHARRAFSRYFLESQAQQPGYKRMLRGPHC